MDDSLVPIAADKGLRRCFFCCSLLHETVSSLLEHLRPLNFYVNLKILEFVCESNKSLENGNPISFNRFILRNVSGID